MSIEEREAGKLIAETAARDVLSEKRTSLVEMRWREHSIANRHDLVLETEHGRVVVEFPDELLEDAPNTSSHARHIEKIVAEGVRNLRRKESS